MFFDLTDGQEPYHYCQTCFISCSLPRAYCCQSLGLGASPSNSSLCGDAESRYASDAIIFRYLSGRVPPQTETYCSSPNISNNLSYEYCSCVWNASLYASKFVYECSNCREYKCAKSTCTAFANFCPFFVQNATSA